MRFASFRILLGVALMSISAASTLAVPYASGVRNTTGSTYEFVLNEAASNVTVLRDGANPLDLGALTAGRYTFDMSGFSTWEVKVKQSTAVTPWTLIKNPDVTSDPNRFYAHFEQPVGIAVNKDPASPYFGVVYVDNSRTNATASGRAMGDGIYALSSDLVGVDLTAGANFYTPYNYADTSFAKAPSPWIVGPGTGTTAAWRMTIDSAGNLIVADWSDTSGGIKYASPDLNQGGLVLAGQNGTPPLPLGDNGKPVHGSIATTPYVTGKIDLANPSNGNLTVWAMDEDLHESLDPAPGSGAHGNHIWKWNVGNQAGATGYNTEPTLEVNTATLSRTTDNRVNYVSINTGVATQATYSPLTKKWYISENRSDGNDAGFIVVAVNPGDQNNDKTINLADYVGIRKAAPNDAQAYADFRQSFGKPVNSVEWSSLQFSIDNSLDGNTSVTTGGANCNGSASCSIQDIFRGMGGEITISPDGKYAFVRQVDLRSATRSNNPYFGTATGSNPQLRGPVIVVPLDANGLPDIHVSGPGGTLTNIVTFLLDANNPTFVADGTTNYIGASSSTSRPIAVDIAGNVYVGDANTERLYAFSPGGATLAVTRSNGTFSLGPASGSLLGGEVPEPTAVTLAICGLMIAFGYRRSR